MSRKPKKPYFIVLEGVDGCGKGTIMELLVKDLYERFGCENVVRTKEPGGTAVGQEIRSVIFPPSQTDYNGSKHMAPGVVDLLFLASHMQNYRTVVEPALDAGKVVVSDRWYHSQAAYQEMRDVPQGVKNLYLSTVSMERQPDSTIFITGDPDLFLERARSRLTESHQKTKAWADFETMRQVQHHYYRLFMGTPGARFVVNDPDTTVEQLFEKVKLLLAADMMGAV